MKFFNINLEQDITYLKASNKYNLAYWVASDVDHYVDNKKNISANEYNRLINQYKIALEIFSEGDQLAETLSDNHQSCAKALRGFVRQSIENFNFFSRKEIQYSESKDIKLLMMVDMEKDFHKEFVRYLLPHQAESFVMKSYEYMTSAAEGLLGLDGCFDSERIYKSQRKIVDNFRLAKKTIDCALENQDCLDGLINEFVIMSSASKANLEDNDLYSFCNKKIEGMQLWREFYSLDEQFYSDIFFCL